MGENTSICPSQWGYCEDELICIFKNTLRSWIKDITGAQGIIIIINDFIAGRVQTLKQGLEEAGRREALIAGAWAQTQVFILRGEL